MIRGVLQMDRKVSEENTASALRVYPEDGGSMFFPKVSIPL
jgi:hypothetical protein